MGRWVGGRVVVGKPPWGEAGREGGDAPACATGRPARASCPLGSGLVLDRRKLEAHHVLTGI